MNTVFRKATCIAVGAFNMYIIQPNWMAKKGFFARSSEIETESKLDEPGFRYEEKGGKVRWIVTPTRVIVETKNEGEDCGAFIAHLLRLLPETPVSAVGNTTFLEVSDGPPLPEVPRGELSSEYNVKERNLHIAIETGKVIYNLSLRWKADGTELLVNSLRPIGDDETALAAVQHAGDFMAHRSTGLALATRVFGV